jgi:hypothetical protein
MAERSTGNVRKSLEARACYRIIEEEAAVVRMVYEYYTVQGLSIAAITRLLNAQGVPIRKRIARWERSTVWAILRNPAYQGKACFGKTKRAARTSALPDRSAFAAAWRRATVPTTSGHRTSGSKSQCRPLSARRALR